MDDDVQCEGTIMAAEDDVGLQRLLAKNAL